MLDWFICQVATFRFNVENLFDAEYLAVCGDSNVTIGEGTSLRLAAQFSLYPSHFKM